VSGHTVTLPTYTAIAVTQTVVDNLHNLNGNGSRNHSITVKQESPADARVTCDSAVIPRRPSAAILAIIEPEMAPCDPLTLKTLA